MAWCTVGIISEIPDFPEIKRLPDANRQLRGNRFWAHIQKVPLHPTIGRKSFYRFGKELEIAPKSVNACAARAFPAAVFDRGKLKKLVVIGLPPIVHAVNKRPLTLDLFFCRFISRRNLERSPAL